VGFSFNSHSLCAFVHFHSFFSIPSSRSLLLHRYFAGRWANGWLVIHFPGTSSEIMLPLSLEPFDSTGLFFNFFRGYSSQPRILEFSFLFTSHSFDLTLFSDCALALALSLCGCTQTTSPIVSLCLTHLSSGGCFALPETTMTHSFPVASGRKSQVS